MKLTIDIDCGIETCHPPDTYGCRFQIPTRDGMYCKAFSKDLELLRPGMGRKYTKRLPECIAACKEQNV